MAANQELLDRAIRHAIYLQRFAGGTANRIVALLNRADADLVEQLRGRIAAVAQRGYDAGPATTKRLEQVLGELRSLNKAAYTAAGKDLTETLRGLADYEVEWQASALGDNLPVKVNVTAPAPRTVAAAALARPFQGRLLREWLTGLEAAKAGRVRDAIRLGLVEGETIEQIVRRIRGTKARGYADGLMEIDRRGAQAMVRTAVNHVAGVAREAVYTDNADILSGWKWVSTLDARTTPICQARDGKVYPLGTPWRPAHIGCRSTSAPVLNDDFAFLSEGATRASKDGQVSDKETYQSWLKRQPAAFQDEVLGPTRGELFRRGGVTLDRFVNRAGDELTLDELRQREPAAFAKVDRARGQPRPPGPLTAKEADFESVGYVKAMGERDGVEYAAAYFPDGRLGLRKRGDRSSVEFTDAEVAQLQGAVLVHNHPRGTSLSLQDLAFSQRAGLREIVAVPSKGPGEFRAKPLMTTERIVQAHVAADRHTRSILKPALDAGRIDQQHLQHLHWHLVNSALHEARVVAYSSTFTPDLEQAIADFGERAFRDAVEAFRWTP